MDCDRHLERAKDLFIAAGLSISGAIVAVGAAIGLNGGIFTALGAPIPMVIAGTFGLAALRSLALALKEVGAFRACGGLHPGCDGEYTNLEKAINGAIVVAGIWASACFKVALVAWIPWGAQPAMWIVEGGLVVSAGLIGALALMLNALRSCSAQIARNRGPLEEGEHASDPWFLRLRPLDEKAGYTDAGEGSMALIPGTERASGGAVRIRCADFTLGEWNLGAVASVVGVVEGPLRFRWTLSGKVLSGTDDGSGRRSTLATTLPPSGDVKLRVEATDKLGTLKFKEQELHLPDRLTICQAILPLPPRKYKSPILEGDFLERFRRASDVFTAILEGSEFVRREAVGEQSDGARQRTRG